MSRTSRLAALAAAALLSLGLVACKSNDNKTAAKPQYTADSCCAKAAAAGKACEHPCCVEATKAGTVCKKCNPA
jgi:hypothetical protein